MTFRKYTNKRILICALAVMIGSCATLLCAFTKEPVVVAAEETKIGTGYVSTSDRDGVNVREEPSTSSKLLAGLSEGTTVDIYGKTDVTETYAWYRVGFNWGGTYTYGYIAADFIVTNIYDSGSSDAGNDYDQNADFEAYMDAQGFPESYRESLRQLHAEYPKWRFVADHNGVDWNTMVAQQNVAGRSLVHYGDPDSWKSTAAGCYDWSTGTYHMYDGYWSQASSEMIEYMLDPRNFLDSTYVFMFESLSYDAGLQTAEGIGNIISGSFMDGGGYLDSSISDYPSALMTAGRDSGVSPYHLSTRIINELGRNNPSDIISGSVAGYGGLYNYYNINAVNGDNSATVNGLIYASKNDSSTMRPWNTRLRAITGGAMFIGSEYIRRGQNTIYYEKFDIKTFWHQYMTYIIAPKSESEKASTAYSASIKDNTSLVFTIPVYDNMPGSVCEMPEKNFGNVNNKLNELSVDGYSLTPTFDLYENEYSLIVDNKVSSIHISGNLVDNLASVDGLGDYSLDVGSNQINIVVTAQSGAKNTYTITVVRQEPDTTGEGTGFSSKYAVSESKKTISNISVGSTASEFKNGISCTGGTTVKVLDTNGSEVAGKVATGNVLTVYNSSNSVIAKYDIVIYGDPTGDGEVDLFDIVKIKRYMLGKSSMEGAYLEAGDCNHDGNVSLFDIVAIKRNMLGKAYITQ